MNKIKLLIITSDIPYPLSMGGNIAQFAFSDYLRHYIDIFYIFPVYNDDDKNNIEKLKKKWENVNIIEVYHPNYFFKEKYVFFRRVIRYIENKILSNSKRNNQIVTNTSNAIFGTALWYLKPLFEEYVVSISETIKKIRPDIIQMEHSRCLSLAEIESFNIPKIFIDHEVQFGMLSSACENTLRNAYTNYVVNLTKNIEINLLKKFDGIFTFSKEDQLKLIENGCANVEAIPFPILSDFFKGIDDKNFKIEKLVFVGGDIHFPNYDAIEWYSKELGKTLYDLFQLKLHVIGNWKKGNIQKLSCEYIIFEGYVEDLYSATRNAINLVPIRMGAGIRTKILNSLAYSQPVITTKIGVEGINIIEGKHVLIFENITDLTEAISKLLNDRAKAIEMCKNAYEFVKVNYSQEFLARKRLEYFEILLSNKK